MIVFLRKYENAPYIIITAIEYQSSTRAVEIKANDYYQKISFTDDQGPASFLGTYEEDEIPDFYSPREDSGSSSIAIQNELIDETVFPHLFE